MAIIRLAYLFDVDGFREFMRPIIEQLVGGELSPLQMAASTMAEKNPQIWSMLADHRLYPDDLGHEEEQFPDMYRRTNLWMMIILASFWRSLEFSVHSISAISSLLREKGWDERDIKRLLVGNSQRALLQPHLVSDLIARPSEPDEWPFWCRFGKLPAFTGWLGLADVQELLAKLHDLSEKSAKIENHELIAGYRTAVRMLSAAESAKCGLFFALVD